MAEILEKSSGLAHLSCNKRFNLLELTMKRHQFQSHALIEVLRSAQELFGFLEIDLLYFIARRLELPPSKVYGVATCARERLDFDPPPTSGSAPLFAAVAAMRHASVPLRAMRVGWGVKY